MLAIVGGKIYTITQGIIEDGTILVENGKIKAVGKDLEVPAEAQVIDAKGKFITPGIIDAHAHVEIWEEGIGWEGMDVNEHTNPITPHVRAIDAINPEGLGMRDAVKGGITCIWNAPGSGNVIGGHGVTMKTYGKVIDEMIMLEPSGIKAALGENPKGYGRRGKMPATRMGSAALMRETLLKAKKYLAKIEKANGDEDKMPEPDLAMEALVKVLRKEIPLRVHCHRHDDIMTAIRIAEEFDINISIEHATEGHKVADELAKRNIPIVVGPSLTTRSKVELRDRTLKTPAICAEAGVKVSIMTDHPIMQVRDLHLAAALAVKYGLSEEDGLKAITINPAELCGVGDRVGSLEPGKDADIVIWTHHPFDIMTKVEKTIINGEIAYSRCRDNEYCCR